MSLELYTKCLVLDKLVILLSAHGITKISELKYIILNSPQPSNPVEASLPGCAVQSGSRRVDNKRKIKSQHRQLQLLLTSVRTEHSEGS